jgi:sugar phosphate isomerase/epimerase
MIWQVSKLLLNSSRTFTQIILTCNPLFMSNKNQYSRRSFITTMAMTGAAMPFVASAGYFTKANSLLSSQPIHVFSKPLQWLGYDDLAAILAEAGAEGIDLSVRPGGHVEPEKVKEDLPRAVEAARKAGLIVNMMVTSITSADDKFTEPILKTASSLGIKFYRLGYYEYNETAGIWNSLQKIKPELKKLEALNKKYNIHGAYQNHSGTRVGGPVWDIHELIRDLDPAFVGCQYDVRHAVVEGGTSWSTGFKLLAPWIKCTDLKDSSWVKKGNKWIAEVVPIGEGFVNFNEYFGLIKKYNIKGPASVHFEYSPFEPPNLVMPLPEKRKLLLEAMKKDISAVKAFYTKFQI